MEEEKLPVKQAYVNQEGTSNELAIKDEIGIDMLKNQLVSLYAEERAFEIGLKNAEEGLENYSTQWKVDEELLDMQLDNFGMLDSAKTHKIHEMPRFWELQKEQFGYKVRHEKVSAEGQIIGYNKEIEVASTKLTGIAADILLKIKELTDIGQEIPTREEVIKND